VQSSVACPGPGQPFWPLRLPIHSLRVPYLNENRSTTIDVLEESLQLGELFDVLVAKLTINIWID